MGDRDQSRSVVEGRWAASALESMRRALSMARRGEGSTYPNPSVGAVVTKGGRILASARSGRTGGAHAEARALARAGGAARGATLFVTLEPCAHVGRTPPCTAAIVEAGIKNVVVGTRDPASHAAGRGIRALRRAGLGVVEGFLGEEARQVHAHYLHHVDTGRPWVTLKAAVSLDGQIACANGHSQWITGAQARRHVHRMRARHHGVAVGSGTVRHDNPRLNVRDVSGQDPIPVVFDSRLALLGGGKARHLQCGGTLVLHTKAASTRARTRADKLGLEVIQIRADGNGRVSLAHALAELGRRPIRSLLVEGGAELLASFVRLKLWQSFLIYQAPRILGQGRVLLPGVGWPSVDEAPAIEVIERRRLGEDVLMVVEPRTQKR